MCGMRRCTFSASLASAGSSALNAITNSFLLLLLLLPPLLLLLLLLLLRHLICSKERTFFVFAAINVRRYRLWI